MEVRPLTQKHLAELALAVERARAQWVSTLVDPEAILSAMDRVVLFLRQTGGASRQARQVSSLAFVVGQQIVTLADWRWMNASDDDGLNPAVVAADERRVLPVLDVATLLVAEQVSGSWLEVARACVSGAPHPWVVER